MIRDTAIISADAVLNWSSELEDEDHNISSVKDKLQQYHQQQYEKLVNELSHPELVQRIYIHPTFLE